MRINWKLSLLLIELIFVIAFFAFAIATHSPFFEQYQHDVLQKERYCNTKTDAKDNDYKKDCEGFLYRTVNDPTAVFTAGLFFFTIILAVATSALIFVTLYGILQQGRSTERLFAVDQRPWLKVEVIVSDKMFSFSKFSVHVNIVVTVENIGKTPAIEVCLPSFYLGHYCGQPDMNALASGEKPLRNISFEKIRDEHRRAIKSAAFKQSITIHTGNKETFKTAIAIPIADLDKIWEEKSGIFYHLVYFCVPYKSSFSKEIYETTTVGSIRFGIFGIEKLPRNEDEYRQIVAIHDLVRNSDAEDIKESLKNDIVINGALSVVT